MLDRKQSEATKGAKSRSKLAYQKKIQSENQISVGASKYDKYDQKQPLSQFIKESKAKMRAAENKHSSILQDADSGLFKKKNGPKFNDNRLENFSSDLNDKYNQIYSSINENNDQMEDKFKERFGTGNLENLSGTYAKPHYIKPKSGKKVTQLKNQRSELRKSIKEVKRNSYIANMKKSFTQKSRNGAHNRSGLNTSQGKLNKSGSLWKTED
jgi:hypothetical protein